jgi:putative methyltransferase (TIGR04325 family)
MTTWKGGLKKIIKDFMPPIVLQLRKRNAGLRLTGNYASWEEAKRASAGYDSKLILEKTKAALLKVKQGVAVYERDSVLFDHVQYSWPLLASLMWVAARHSGRLNVLDFGGSLGSTYFQNRVFLSSLPEVHWNVIEQQNHVEVGKEFFEDDRLKFFGTVRDCAAASQPNVVILGSILQYLERPYDVLSQLMGLRCEHIIIDRTPFWEGSEDMICVQHVPQSIYSASYPTWIFSMPRFLSTISAQGHKLIVAFETPDNLAGPVDLEYRGMIVVKSDVMP